MKSGYSEKFLRKRKFLLVLPVLVLPFVTLAFYALGGGKGDTNSPKGMDESQGMNVRLPGATQKQESMLDKMSFYQQAERDSARIHDQEKSDPYFKSSGVPESARPADTLSDIEKMTAGLSGKYNQTLPPQAIGLNTSPIMRTGNADANEQKIMMKLAELNKAINQPADVKTSFNDPDVKRRPNSQTSGQDVDRLENMMQIMNSSDGPDSDMQELNGTLEKIIDIQHPERMNEKIRQASAKHNSQVFPVSRMGEDNKVSLIQSSTGKRPNGDTIRRIKTSHNTFFSLEDNAFQEPASQNSIEAVIDETQSLVSGATVKLRLTSDVYINGTFVPRNTLVFGTSSLNDERLNIKLSSIRYRNFLFPVSLSVYDMDGMEGIFIPGAISRDVAKESAGQVLQGIGLTTFDPSVSAQAASAGIQAAKTLLTRKAKLIKVSVKSGYQVLLKDASLKN